jgi:hypothetical protein
MKAEIDKILEECIAKTVNAMRVCNNAKEAIKVTDIIEAETTTSLTSLIIKWLEGKRGQQCLVSGKYEELKDYGRNQLITELMEELK